MWRKYDRKRKIQQSEERTDQTEPVKCQAISLFKKHHNGRKVTKKKTEIYETKIQLEVGLLKGRIHRGEPKKHPNDIGVANKIKFQQRRKEIREHDVFT